MNYIYVIKKKDLYKIGQSKDVQKRFQDIQQNHPETLELINYYPTKNPNFAEQNLHQLFESKNVNGEWFNLNEVDLKYINDYFTHIKNVVNIPLGELKRLKNLKNMRGKDMGEIYSLYIKNSARRDIKEYIENQEESKFMDKRCSFYLDHYQLASREHLEALKDILFTELQKKRLKLKLNKLIIDPRHNPSTEEKFLKNLTTIDKRLDNLLHKLCKL